MMTTCYKCTGSGFIQYQRAMSSTEGTQVSLVGELCLLCHGSGRTDFKKINGVLIKTGFFENLALLATLVSSIFICLLISDLSFYAASALLAKIGIMIATFIVSFFVIGTITILPLVKQVLKWSIILIAFIYALSIILSAT